MTLKFPILVYTPEIAPAVVCIICYTIVTAIHGYFVFKKPKFLSMLPVFIGGIMLIGGYATRLIVRTHLYNIPIYSISTLLILLPPSLFAASIYMCFGRYLKFIHHESASVVRVDWVTKVFLMGDIISFICQGIGGALQTLNNLNTKKIGTDIALAGLSIQVAFVAVFLFVMIIAHYRLLKSPPLKNAESSFRSKYTWKTFLTLLYIGVILIIIRCVYRLIEFDEGYRGLMNDHEVFMYLLDALPMFLWMALFCILHPRHFMSNASVYDDTEMLNVYSKQVVDESH